jgi:putative nucleotidyltransferase with HDIG domain
MDEQQRRVYEKLTQHLRALPLLPNVVVQLLSANSNDDGYFEEVTRLIGLDPAFATRVLSYGNSASLAAPGSKPLTRLKDALARIGTTDAVNMVLASSAARVFLPRKEWERGLWRHALDTAELGKRVGAVMCGTRIDPDEVYLAGLLHDLGRFILYLEAPETMRDVEETTWETPHELIEAEMRVCGFDHAQLGYLAAQRWQLPERLALVIRRHHAPPPSISDGPVSAIVAAVRIADWLAVRLAKTNDWRALPPAELREVVSTPMLPPGAWTPEILAAIRLALDRSAMHAELLGLGRPPNA